MRGPGCLRRRLCYDALFLNLSYEAHISPALVRVFYAEEFDLFPEFRSRAFAGFFRFGAFERV